MQDLREAPEHPRSARKRRPVGLPSGALSCLLLLLLATGCSTVVDEGENEVKEYVRVGERIPTFSVETVYPDGNREALATDKDARATGTFSTAALTGETVIVLFHTSCGDCQRELPRLNDYYLLHRSDPGFQMVAISREEGAESIAAYWRTQGLSIPYSPQTDRRIYNLFASSVIPRVYFCSAAGIVTKICIERLDF